MGHPEQMDGCLPSQLLFVVVKVLNAGLQGKEIKLRKAWEGQARVSREALSRTEMCREGGAASEGKKVVG